MGVEVAVVVDVRRVVVAVASPRLPERPAQAPLLVPPVGVRAGMRLAHNPQAARDAPASARVASVDRAVLLDQAARGGPGSARVASVVRAARVVSVVRAVWDGPGSVRVASVGQGVWDGPVVSALGVSTFAQVARR